MVKFKLFQHLMILLAILLIPTALLFSYANRFSNQVLQQTLEGSASKQLEYTVNNLEQSLRQIETQSLLLLNDASIKSYATASLFPDYVDHLLLRRTVEDKLTVHSEANPMIHNLTLYFPTIEETISRKTQGSLPIDQLAKLPRNRWFKHEQEGANNFRLIFTSPTYPAQDFSNIQIVLETSVSAEYLRTVLQTMDSSGNGTSFFYFDKGPFISNHELDNKLVPLLQSENMLGDQEAHDTARRLSLKVDGVSYAIQSIQSPSLGGTLVSYVKLDSFLSPLQRMNQLVYFSLLLLVLTGLSFVYLLYRHFRMPFGYLVRKLQTFGEGDMNSRATARVNNEFNFLFARFNEMASRIQSLIENVYEERVRAREAEYKHLQSQINPHFLYNCLFYIVTMAHKSPEAVVAMAKNLSQFYRYITKKVGSDVTFANEIDLVKAYLTVQSLRNKHLSYEMNIPDAIMRLSVPTLILQPIIENAINHGLDRKHGSGRIVITGEMAEGKYKVIVDDDGAGLTPSELDRLRQSIFYPSVDTSANEMSCGLLNIHQRLTHRYGNGTGIAFAINEWGGLRVTLTLS